MIEGHSVVTRRAARYRKVIYRLINDKGNIVPVCADFGDFESLSPKSVHLKK